MHPPPFRRTQFLTDWPDCWIEARCNRCGGRSVSYPVKLLIQKGHGNRSFAHVVSRLKCSVCGQSPAPVYLCASPHREGGHGGPSPDWAVELVSFREN